MTTKLTLTKPDDWHIHLRDGDFLNTTVLDAKKQFQRVIVMPNLKPPVNSLEQVLRYHAAIKQVAGGDDQFQPLMTLYLTEAILPATIIAAKNSGLVFGCKLYPAGSTTHSDHGIQSIAKLYPVFEAMQAVDLPLLVHGEVTDPRVDVFDREAKFIDQVLVDIVEQFPNLRIVLEHITTQEGVEFIQKTSNNIAATITAHHLLLNRNDLLVGGLRPHHYCLPVLKRLEHQESLLAAATSGNPKFFLGTDSAPHPKSQKEAACGCAGIYTAHAAIELYAEAFESRKALDKLEGFASFYGPDFYQLPRNAQTITLVKQDWQVPSHYPYGGEQLIPFRAGQTIRWKLVSDD